VKKGLKTRKKNSAAKSPARKPRRLALTVGVAIAIIAIAAVTVISKQNGAALRPTAGNQQGSSLVNEANKNYVTVKVAGRDVQVDSQTGQVKPLTPEEAQRLAAGLNQMINQSTEGLVEKQEADGSVSMDLDGRFQNVTVARVNEDGSVSEGCVDNRQAAAEFFGIDPQLVENPADSSKTTVKQPRAKNTRN
jgi:hypothetical protein